MVGLVKETRNVDLMTWKDFRRVFEAQYRTADVVAVKVQEFISLQQGEGSVKDYSTRFDVLASFAPGMVSTPSLRLDRFLQGLRPEIALHVLAGPQPPQTYEEALERALRLEVYVNKLPRNAPSMSTPPSLTVSPIVMPSRSALPASLTISAPVTTSGGSSIGSSFRNNRGKRKFQSKASRKGWKSDKKPRKENIPQCQICGRRHSGECWYQQKQVICYRCRQPGHIAKDCQSTEVPVHIQPPQSLIPPVQLGKSTNA